MDRKLLCLCGYNAVTEVLQADGEQIFRITCPRCSTSVSSAFEAVTERMWSELQCSLKAAMDLSANKALRGTSDITPVGICGRCDARD